MLLGSGPLFSPEKTQVALPLPGGSLRILGTKHLPLDLWPHAAAHMSAPRGSCLLVCSASLPGLPSLLQTVLAADTAPPPPSLAWTSPDLPSSCVFSDSILAFWCLLDCFSKEWPCSYSLDLQEGAGEKSPWLTHHMPEGTSISL